MKPSFYCCALLLLAVSAQATPMPSLARAALGADQGAEVGPAAPPTGAPPANAEDPGLSLPELEVPVEIAGVARLEDYAAVTALLAEVPGVRRVSIESAVRDRAIFRVLVRGGPEALAAALDVNGALQRLGGSPARLSYQYGR